MYTESHLESTIFQAALWHLSLTLQCQHLPLDFGSGGSNFLRADSCHQTVYKLMQMSVGPQKPMLTTYQSSTEVSGQGHLQSVPQDRRSTSSSSQLLDLYNEVDTVLAQWLQYACQIHQPRSVMLTPSGPRE